MPTIPRTEIPAPKSWDEVEDIVDDLYRRLWDDPHAQRYGRSGQAQQGVDIYGQPAHLDGRCAGIQCKRYAAGALTRAIVEAEHTSAAVDRSDAWPEDEGGEAVSAGYQASDGGVAQSRNLQMSRREGSLRK